MLYIFKLRDWLRGRARGFLERKQIRDRWPDKPGALPASIFAAETNIQYVVLDACHFVATWGNNIVSKLFAPRKNVKAWFVGALLL